MICSCTTARESILTKVYTFLLPNNVKLTVRLIVFSQQRKHASQRTTPPPHPRHPPPCTRVFLRVFRAYGALFTAMTDHQELQREQKAKVFTNELVDEDEVVVVVRRGAAQRAHPSSLH